LCVPRQDSQPLGGACIPEADRIVVAGRGEEAAVGGEGYVVDGKTVPRENPQAPPRGCQLAGLSCPGDRPQPGRPILTRRCQLRPIPRKRQRGDASRVSPQVGELSPRGDLPQANPYLVRAPTRCSHG